MKEKLQKIVTRVSGILSEHAKASGFVPVGLELGFGGSGPLPPLTFTLKNGCTMELVGRIDRVDKAESSKGLLLRIVDYKSSDRGLIWLRCITGSLCKCSHILTYRLHIPKIGSA